MGKRSKDKQDYEEWLKNIVEGYFLFVKVIFLYPLIIGILMKVLLSIIQDSRLNDSVRDIVAAYFVIGSSFLFDFIDKKHIKYKVYFSILVIEIVDILCFSQKTHAARVNSNYYILLSCYMSFFCGFFLFTNRYLGFLMQIKSIYFWIFLDYTQNEVDSYMNYFGFTFITFFAVGCSVVRNMALKIIYDYKRELNTSNQNLQIILDTLPDGLFVISSQGEIKLINKALKDMLNIDTKADLVNHLRISGYSHERRFYHQNNPESFLYDDIQDYIQSDKTESVTFGLTKAETNSYEWRGSNCELSDLNSAIILVRDMTNIISLEKTSAEQKCETAIIRSFSHELRTPISAIISATEIISRRLGRLTNEIKDPLEVIQVSSNLLLTIINDLIDFILIIGGNLKLNYSYFNIQSVITNAINQFKLQASEKKLILTSNIDPTIPLFAFNDPNRLHQVLINILSNSLKFTFQGEIRLNAKLKDESVKISVKDTGIGISEERLDNILNLFESVDLQKNTHSCGLGLHITSMLVNELGSRKLEVKSVINQFSKFTFYVNIGLNDLNWEDSTNENVLPIFIPSIKQNGLNNKDKDSPYVLIVDDNDFNRLILSEFLKSEHILFDEAIHGKQAVEAVKLKNKDDKGYRLIVMDCQMPVMDGWEASMHIHKMFSHGEIQSMPAIIAHTAYFGAEEETKSYEAGMLEFLRKPVSRDYFLQVVKKYIQ